MHYQRLSIFSLFFFTPFIFTINFFSLSLSLSEILTTPADRRDTQKTLNRGWYVQYASLMLCVFLLPAVCARVCNLLCFKYTHTYSHRLSLLLLLFVFYNFVSHVTSTLWTHVFFTLYPNSFLFQSLYFNSYHFQPSILTSLFQSLYFYSILLVFCFLAQFWRTLYNVSSYWTHPMSIYVYMDVCTCSCVLCVWGLTR